METMGKGWAASNGRGRQWSRAGRGRPRAAAAHGLSRVRSRMACVRALHGGLVALSRSREVRERQGRSGAAAHRRGGLLHSGDMATGSKGACSLDTTATAQAKLGFPRAPSGSGERGQRDREKRDQRFIELSSNLME